MGRHPGTGAGPSPILSFQVGAMKPVRPLYHAWYKLGRWQKLRAQQLAAEPLCRYCKERGLTTPATIANHRTPHKGDAALFWDAANLESTCKLCHDSTVQSAEKLGFRKGCDASGRPIDPAHPWNRP